MPTPISAEEKPKKRAPRKRVATKRALVTKTAKKSAPRKAVRRRVPRKKATTKEVDSRVEERIRKAPTPIAANRASHNAQRKKLMIVFSVIIVSIGLSAGVGLLDEGQIDVNQEIEARNERIRSGQVGENESQQLVIPVQNTEANKLPDGGLIGLGVGAEPPAPAPEPASTTASSTASTTDTTASSTDEAADLENEPLQESVDLDASADDSEELEEVTEPEPVIGGEVSEEQPTSGR